MTSLIDLVHDDRSARMLLATISTPNDPVTGKLLTTLGAVEVINLIENDATVPGLDRAETEVWRARHNTTMSFDYLADKITHAAQFQTLVPGDPHWPTALNDLGFRAPYVLWVKGNADTRGADLHRRVTITGARTNTGYGQQITTDLVEAFAENDYVTIAGGAYGIEAAAHRGALSAGGSTIAVLPAGIDRAYPAAHQNLFERIEENGLLMSELPPGTSPTRQRFIDRDRILAALSGATVVVEAGARSGSIEVARQAQNLGRGVGAVPGPVTSVTSYGTNLLIQNGTARLIANFDDVKQLTTSRSTPDSAPNLQRTIRGLSAPDSTRSTPSGHSL